MDRIGVLSLVPQPVLPRAKRRLEIAFDGPGVAGDQDQAKLGEVVLAPLPTTGNRCRELQAS